MAKITLGKPPKTFAPVAVTFPMPDGTEGQITCTFKYRTRKDFGAFLERTAADAGVSQEAGVSDITALIVAKNGAYIADVLDAWDLDEKLTPASAAQLADELPAAAQAVMDAYARAVTAGRLGN